ncbi:STE3-domain-containing protein [Tricholoma matsutake]|nr:STE3-domain-containing protein [Tricholoma matsutake 945]
MAASNRVFSLFSFIGILLCCIPFPRHLQSWNTGTCLLMAWDGVACLVYFINSIIWSSNTNNSAPVWCDITSCFGNAVAVAIPTAVMCATRRLYLVVTRNTIDTRAKRRHAVIVDLALGFGIPVIAAILLYIPQNGRFLLYEDFGPLAIVSNTPVGIVLQTMPQLLISLVCTVYSVMIIYILREKRLRLSEILSSNSNMSTSTYVRLLIIAVIGSAVLLPLCIWLFIDPWSSVYPWPGWKETHADMSYIQKVPARVWRSDPSLLYNLEITRWEYVLCAFLFFACFGLHHEARASYQSVIRRFVPLVPHGRTFRSRDVIPANPAGAIPLVFAHGSTSEKRSFSFSTNLTKVFADINGAFSRTQNTIPSTISYRGLSLPDESSPHTEHDAGQSSFSTNPEPHTEIATPPGFVTKLERAPAFTSSVT